MKRKMSREEKNRLAIVIGFVSLLVISVNAFWWFTTGRPYRELMRDTEQQTYTPTPITAPGTDTSTQAVQPGRSEAGTPQTQGEADTVSEAESPNPINTDTTEAPDTAVPAQADSAHREHSDADISAEDQMIQELLEEGERRIKAADALLERTDRLLENSDAALKKGISRLVGELNAMSIEEQRAFFKQVKAGLSDLIPPEIEEMLTPEMKDQAWTDFWNELAEAGYTPPEGL